MLRKNTLYNILILQGKSLESDQCTMKQSIRQRKRHPSSVLKAIQILAPHVKAAKYILVIVFVLLFTWTPWFSYVLYENILHLTQNKSEVISGNMNATTILECLNNVLQEKVCNVTMQSIHENVAQETIENIIHLDEANIVGILAMFLSSLNSMANPILYAFWYSEFRKYFLLLVPRCFFCQLNLIN